MEIEAAVDNILMKLIQVSAADVALAAREKTPGWSSLMHIEIFFSLEEEFGVRFDDDAMAFAESRNELVETVLAAISK
jgi:acyl carrier protein